MKGSEDKELRCVLSCGNKYTLNHITHDFLSNASKESTKAYLS